MTNCGGKQCHQVTAESVSFFFSIIGQLAPSIYHVLGSADNIEYKQTHTLLNTHTQLHTTTHTLSNDEHTFSGVSMEAHTRAQAHSSVPIGLAYHFTQ